METPTSSNSKSQAPLALLSQLTNELAANRPGFQTTEFALVALSVIAIIVFAAIGKIPPILALPAASMAGIGYGWLRNNRKGARETALLGLVNTFATSFASLNASTGLNAALAAVPPLVTVHSLPDGSQQITLPSQQGRESSVPKPNIVDVSQASSAATPGAVGALVPLIALFFALSLFVVGCATNTGDPSKDRAGRVTNQVLENLAGDVGKLAVGALENAVTTAASGDTHGRDLQQAAATGAWQSVGTIDVGADLEKVINAWNGGSAPQVAAAAANVFTVAAPQTAADKAAVVSKIAATINTAAAKATPPSGASASPASHTLFTSAGVPVQPAPQLAGPTVITHDRN